MDQKKVAIVNRTNLKNYGSVLQVWALCRTVNKLGYNSCVVWQRGNLSRNFDIRPNKIIQSFLKLLLHPSLFLAFIRTIREVKSKKIDIGKVEKFENFVSQNFNQFLYSQEDLVKIARTDTYYKFICGSDQVWCSTTLYPDPTMYLRFAPESKRIAYAPSIGRDYIPSYNRKIMKSYINDIPFISIREDDGKRLIKELTDRIAPVVADPTLLISDAEWDTLKIEIATPKKYILCYFLDSPSDDVMKGIRQSASQIKCDLVVLGEFDTPIPNVVNIHRPTAGPGEFIYLISNAYMVITDSYHGMLFSIIYKKNFWAVERAYVQYDQSSRHQTILSILGLTKRYLKDSYDFNSENIDYINVQDKLTKFINKSMEYLKVALN